jgi:hypothetical protein
MPNHDLESLQARTSRGAFFTPAPKLGATGRKKGGRPSTYTEVKGAEICRRMVGRGNRCGLSANHLECRLS